MAGADPYEGDRLGRMKLTKAGLQRRDELTLRWCRQRSIPVAVAMSGGYANNIDDIVSIHATTLATASSVATEY